MEKRASISVFTPGLEEGCLGVPALTSSVVSKTPNAPEPLACGRRSGTFSRLKWASVSIRCTSCSSSGPFGPTERLLRSLALGAPLTVREPLVSADVFPGIWPDSGVVGILAVKSFMLVSSLSRA